MKKILLPLLIMVSGLASAQGGFVGPGSNENNVITVKQAHEMPEDSIITLQGYIIASLGDEEYTFKSHNSDDTIKIEIDNNVWGSLNITPEDLISISGEVDSEWTEATIDVDSIQAL